MGWFKKFRRKLASIIVGEQVALFMPKAACTLAKSDLFEQMDDVTLAAYTRWFFAVLRPIYERNAVAEELGIGTYSNIHGVLSLVRTARQCNAGELVLVQSCVIEGEDAGIWQMTLRQLEEYEFGEPGAKETWDGDKLVRLEVSRDFRKQSDGL